MADFSKLTADIATLSAKVDVLVSEIAALKASPPPPVDDQSSVDAAAAAVEAVLARIP